MELLLEIEIPLYIRKAVLSQSRQKKYYIRGKNEPKFKKYQDGNRYVWKEKKVIRKGKPVNIQMLYDLKEKEFVVANPRTAGTERRKAINGQSLYSGAVREHTRNKVMEQIKDQMRGIMKDIPPITKFPINIRLLFYDVFHDPDIPTDIWDVGNRMWPYQKAFEDVLQEFNIIPDDERRYVTAPPAPIYFPIDSVEDRKLVFRIYRDDREYIKQSKYYKHLFNDSN